MEQKFNDEHRVEGLTYSMYTGDVSEEDIKSGNIPIKITSGELNGMILRFKDVKLKDIDDEKSDILFDFDIIQTPYEGFSDEYDIEGHEIHEIVKNNVCSILLDAIELMSAKRIMNE